MKTTNDNYQRSAVNRTRYGEMLDHVLPCRRDSCAMLDTCPLVGTPDRRPGYSQPCPVEHDFIEDYVESLRSTLAPALGLDHNEADAVATRLATLECRRMRSSARLRHAWDIINEDGSRPAAFYQAVALTNRYSTAIDKEVEEITRKLGLTTD